MEVLFVVVVPLEHVSDPPRLGEPHLPEFTVKEQTPFSHVRETNDGRCSVLNVAEMVTSALSGMSKGFVCAEDPRHNQLCITFPAGGSRSLAIFQRLQQLGVGEHFGSINVMPLAVSASVEAPKTGDALLQTPSNGPSLKMRQVIENIRWQSKITFDVVILVLVAGILASVGLATDSAVMVVASMLISPLMGPILGMGFGTVISDWKMLLHGTISETIMLLLCVLTGFVVGIPFAIFDEQLEWPTSEMVNRGKPIALLYGLVVAIPSGIGVAMSILQDNATGLVGVAISASLLPPAVNAGIFLAFLTAGSHSEYSKSELLQMAFISFLLTALNIICIYGSCILWFKVKEIAPYHTKSDVWKCYIEEVVRHRTLKGQDASKMKRLLQKELGQSAAAAPDFDLTTVGMTLRNGETFRPRPRPGLSSVNLDDIFSPPATEETSLHNQGLDSHMTDTSRTDR